MQNFVLLVLFLSVHRPTSGITPTVRDHELVVTREIKVLGGDTRIVNVVNGVTKPVPIHVVVGDVIRVNVTNRLPEHGISIHWHGFDMRGELIFQSFFLFLNLF